MNRIHNIKETDRKIRKALRATRQPLPDNECFVRRTINRLPPKRKKLMSLPEIVAIAVSLIAISIVIGTEYMKLTIATDPTAFDFSMLTAALAMTLCTIAYITTQLLLRECRC